MLSLSLAAALAAQPTAATPAVDPDIRCMAAYLFAVGQMADDPATTAEDKAGGTAIVMYYFGKIRGRSASTDVKNTIKRLVEVPTYLTAELKPDLERCGAEYEQRGKELDAFDD
jgi:hypothetical protein